MKICLIHAIYKPYYRGGAEVVFANIVEELKRRGDNFFIITLGYKNAVEEVDGIKVYRIKPCNLFNFLDINNKPAWLRLPWHLLDMFNDVQAWRVYRILDKEKPDLIYGQGLKGLGYLLPAVIRALKLKFIYGIYDMQLISPTGLLQSDGQRGLMEKIYGLICRRLFSSPTAVIFPSQYAKAVYDKFNFFPRSKKIVLGNPLRIADNPAKPKAAEGKTVNFLFLGQVVKYKGIMELIGAIKQTPGNLQLHVVGDGAGLDTAKEAARGDQRIIFHGQLDQERLEREIWPQTDLLVNPSQVPETFGMVVIEAFSHGLPVIASNIGALTEIVSHNKTGWLVEPGNEVALRERIKRIMAEPQAPGKMSAACLAAAKKYSADKYVEALLASVK